MYGLPKDFDVSVFIGKTLDLVCFSVNTVNLIFEKNVSIIIMSSFIYQHNCTENTNIQKIPVSSSDLMCLVGQVIEHAEGHENGALVLHLDNGQILTILDEFQQYESYMINIGDKEIIV